VRRALALLAATAALAGWLAPSAAASFGLNGFDVAFTNADGTPATQAGSHPFAVTTAFGVNYTGTGPKAVTEGRVRDAVLEAVRGFAGDPSAYPRCSTLDFAQVEGSYNACPLDTQVGIVANQITEPGTWTTSPIFNVAPPPGVLLRLGFRVANVVNVVVDVGVSTEPPYRPTAALRNTSELVYVYGSKAQLWGNPSDPAHDELRGECGGSVRTLPPGDVADYEFESETGKSCPVAPNPRPFLTLPTTCGEPLPSSYRALSWEGATASGSVLTHDAKGNPAPFKGCGKLAFHPTIAAKPTTLAAQSPTGLDFSLDVQDEGIRSLEGLAASDVEKAVVTLPQGMTVNPSQAEGLAVCSEADLARETLDALPGEGCPQASKIGTVEVESPLLEGELLKGSLFVAKPYENQAQNSLIAFYIVIKDPSLGIRIVQPARVDPDPATGQLITTTEDIPQLPFSHFRLHFREGGRSPLISPPGCGPFTASAKLYPWSGGAPVTSNSTFQIVSGPDNGPCPKGPAPFHPGFEAGSLDNAAGAYSPFAMRLTRKDGEQDMGRFSFVLPPGVVPKLAGIPYCPEAAIARAKSRSGPHGGAEELADPSCPAASQIGRTVAGAGVGSQLTYVPGKLYLAGPYHGDPISAVSITPGLAGPFDAGTVVVREALRLNPVTHVGEVDGSASDPIPHILKGIPLNVRELQVYADRPEFTLNPTNCSRFAAQATIWGEGTALEPRPETPVGLSSPYQAADCAALPFKPKLGLKLRGATKRGGFPALHAVYTPRPGDANLADLSLQFPRSEFVEQGHFRTICTRVQFAAGDGFGSACPEGSVYGHVRAYSPLLAQPLEGPVFLRSSNHNLPDAIFALHGLVDIEVDVRIDSHHGHLRATLEGSPDAPVSRAIVDMQGAAKGLFVNSTSLCGQAHRAIADLSAQNGKLERITPAMRALGCRKAHR
jgi:hypothetical protein